MTYLMRDEGFRSRQADRLISIVHEENLGSIRVARKIGFVDRGSVHLIGRVYRRYEAARSEWEAMLNRPPTTGIR
jgi:RimJ/RimL family protein N-acetyltransferase